MEKKSISVRTCHLTRLIWADYRLSSQAAQGPKTGSHGDMLPLKRGVVNSELHKQSQTSVFWRINYLGLKLSKLLMAYITNVVIGTDSIRIH